MTRTRHLLAAQAFVFAGSAALRARRGGGSVPLRLAEPVFRRAFRTAWSRYGNDLDGIRMFLDRTAAAGAVLARPARGCVISDGGLAGGSTREYTPATAVPGRTVLYLHGGGFVMYSPRAYDGFLSRLAGVLQARIIVPDYRLAPEHPFPAGVDDCFTAYEALIADGQAPAQLLVAGESAGANATLVTMQRARAAGLPMPAGAVLMSGGFDATWASPSITNNLDLDVVTGPHALAFLEEHFLSGLDRADPRVSPMYGTFAGLPPLLFQAGSTEVLVDDSVRAAERARAAAVVVRLEVFPHAPHAWHQLGTWLPETRKALEQIEDFARVACGWTASS